MNADPSMYAAPNYWLDEWAVHWRVANTDRALAEMNRDGTDGTTGNGATS